MRILVTGATGYVGGRLVPELLERGHEVVCAARSPAKLDARPWRDRVEVRRADVLDGHAMTAACADVDVVYYLVHAMDGHGDFASREQAAAATVRDAAAAAGVARLVYLGGLGVPTDGLSPHLASRQAVGATLAAGPVPVTELRAAVIIGSGSASFEMLRHLVEVLPVMVTPTWVDTRCQPIAIRDVLTMLCAVLDVPETAGRIIEIGGPDVLTYREMMRIHAEVAGLRRRLVLPVPVLTPRLSSLWVGLVTPLPPGLARPLIDSLVNEVVVTDDTARRLLPPARTGFRDAVVQALRRVQDLDVSTRWSGAGGPADPRPEDPSWAGGTVLTDTRTVVCPAPPDVLFATVCTLGGERGYRSSRLLWAVRGVADRLVGGAGLRRGRRRPEQLAVGDALDFWRVEVLDPPNLLRLRAEMRLPGDAWLEFRIDEHPAGSRLTQRARFRPRGLWGRVYWAVLTPFHRLVFPTMARRLVGEATAAAGAGGSALTARAAARR